MNRALMREMLGDMLHDEMRKPYPSVEGQLESLRELVNRPKPDFKVGDRVKQNHFGNNLRYPEQRQVAVVAGVFPKDQVILDSKNGNAVDGEIALMMIDGTFGIITVDLRLYEKVADDAEA